jgi:molybdopterin-containing oxidoreductase family iron-sulfur binding subunit
VRFLGEHQKYQITQRLRFSAMKTENKKTYWKGLEQLANTTEFVKANEKEFPQHLTIKDAYGDNSENVSSNRRDFLKLMGFSLAAVSMAACEAPVRKAIPYLNKPEDVDPGIPNYYASTYVMGGEVCPVVVKTREGRPIFLEGNTLSKWTNGGINARVQASVMSLYDNEKVKAPSKGGAEIDWESLDKEVISALESAGQIRVVSYTNVSPSTKKALADFASKYTSSKLVTYDAESASGMIEANKRQFGKAAIPSYNFTNAEVVVGVSCDFLGGWISDIEHSYQYAQNRKVGKKKKTMSQHFQFESLMSITGASADYRTAIKPSQEGLVIGALYNEVASAVGQATISVPAFEVPFLKLAAQKLVEKKGKSLLVSGSNDVAVQVLVNSINQMLGNYGSTIDLNNPLFTKQGNDAEMAAFIEELNNGSVGAVIFYNCNPVYDHPQGAKLASAIAKAKVSISTADTLDETTSLCTYNAPDTHFLEAWNDAEVKKGMFLIGQPTIAKIFKTRQAQESFLTWAGKPTDFYSYVKENWKQSIFPLQKVESEFESFWNRSLHDGVVDVQVPNEYMSANQAPAVTAPATFELGEYANAISARYKADNSGIELLVYANTILGIGNQANNPILQEVPEPISRVCWGHFVSVPQSMAKELGFTSFETKTNIVRLKSGESTIELPVVVQPGQAKGTVAIALGYGRKTGKVAAMAGGINAFQFTSMFNGTVSYTTIDGVSVEKTSAEQHVAQTQTHHTILGRETIIQEASLAEYAQNDQAGRYFPHITGYKGAEKPNDVTLWDVSSDGYEETNNTKTKDTFNDRIGIKADTHNFNNHHWGMVIDLNSCNGCGACVVACNIENNIPVVGKQEVINRREMHWLRIDRYYSTDADITNRSIEGYRMMEEASDNPEVVFQPMMCQHCNNAPCETVCPVAATTHSSEGLNQMTYNRCVGTKYCANNCPYKVRRFNWFKYHDNKEFDFHTNNDLGKMVLNPDVTVRSRGVMEKCSMCVQRIQAGKLKAKSESRRPKDGEIVTACQAACTTGAIVFGDLNDKESKARQILEDELTGRAYNVLEEINVRPNIWYLTKIRNKEKQA